MLWSVRGQESLGQVLLESLQVVELREAVKVGRGQGRDGARRPQVGRGQGVGGQGTGGQGVGGPLKVLQPGVQQRELTNLKESINIQHTEAPTIFTCGWADPFSAPWKGIFIGLRKTGFMCGIC